MRADARELADHWYWRPGWQVGTRYLTWHVTLEDQPELRRFAAAHREALRPFEVLDVVPEQWLHVTMQGVGHVADVTDHELADMVEAVRDQLAGVLPEPTTFGRPTVGREAVAVGTTGAGPLRRVRRAVRAGMARALGPGRVPGVDEGYEPHVSLAYANAAGSAAGVRAALDLVTAAPVTTSLRRVSLLELHRDRRMYEWATVEQVPLG